jgi:hypothetical protein
MQRRLWICLLVPLWADLSILWGEVSISLDSDLESGLVNDWSGPGHVEPFLKNKNKRITFERISYFECTMLERLLHKVDIYRVPQCMSSCLDYWDSPTPSPASECGGVQAHTPAGEGVRESQFRQLRKSLALCLMQLHTGADHVIKRGIIKRGWS